MVMSVASPDLTLIFMWQTSKKKQRRFAYVRVDGVLFLLLGDSNQSRPTNLVMEGNCIWSRCIQHGLNILFSEGTAGDGLQSSVGELFGERLV